MTDEKLKTEQVDQLFQAAQDGDVAPSLAPACRQAHI